MIVTTSVSQLRSNISSYLDQVSRGTSLLVRDEKRKKVIAKISQFSQFNSDTYQKALKKASGSFTSENHPEWTTQADVSTWLTNSRQTSDRIL